jgi:hypothetical protein
LQAAKKAAAAAPAAAPVKLKGTLARMDPAQLIQHLNIDINVQSLQDVSSAPPVRTKDGVFYADESWHSV